MHNASAIIQPLSRAEYDRLVALGYFEDERVELIRGELVSMSPQGPLHTEVLHRIMERLMERLSGRARLRLQGPLAVSEDSQPEPDLALVAAADYSGAHPRTAFLVVEVADSSLGKDREVKSALYARAGIPEYWIINLVEGIIEVRTRPRGGEYHHVSIKNSGDELCPVAFPDICIAVDSIV